MCPINPERNHDSRRYMLREESPQLPKVCRLGSATHARIGGGGLCECFQCPIIKIHSRSIESYSLPGCGCLTPVGLFGWTETRPWTQHNRAALSDGIKHFLSAVLQQIR